jgi:hypothetical protein
MRTTVVTIILAVYSAAPGALRAEPRHWDFEQDPLGGLPAGWTAAKTGEGEGSVWKVVEDTSAPRGAHTLAQLAAGPRPLFNLCVADGPAPADLTISVAFKAVDGKIDQGGGVIWRYADPNNYYIARFNPLEDNFRLYKVVDGKRIQLATKEGLKAPAGQWHTLSVTMKGDAIECSLNGKMELVAKDGTFAGAGKVGLWTKADAHTHFDKLEVSGVE